MSTTPKRILAKSLEKRQRILDAAAKILARHGYAEATLAAIADDVGTHAGSIYYYFPSREDLVKEVLLTSLKRMRNTVQPSPDEDNTVSPLTRLKTTLRNILILYTSAQDDFFSRAYTRTFNQVPETMRQELADWRRVVRGLWRQRLREAQEAGELRDSMDIELASLLLVGATNWVPMWYNPDGPHTPDEIADTFIDMLLNGLASPDKSS
jgi:AcrR family transcriptional regulator